MTRLMEREEEEMGKAREKERMVEHRLGGMRTSLVGSVGVLRPS
jgi:hypothetical protein